jgi:hypothetical protein
MSINNQIIKNICEPQVKIGNKPSDPEVGDIWYDGNYNYVFTSNKWVKFKAKVVPSLRRINKIKKIYELR